ncbi:DNA-binding response regulator [Arenicella chitinivorans]|uniref:DNA-binding response regulator n=1 Tax=Arenicella chitinivorans TaxID=1329800 RepID=A0A918RLH4_9GAMM|nr:LytTR family DNA-binding domain-containing protein [Arenicella chitinivorans]GHA01045.1 DNA-binding response regulator [Arenicella chitinivorans]
MTQPVRILHAEDEAPQRRAFRDLIAQIWPEAELVASCKDGESAIAACQQLSPDVAFLDIRMPNKSGLDVARQIGDHTFVVFTTAYDQYAINAFESGAVDYLLKPLTAVRFSETVARLRTRIEQQQPVKLDQLLATLDQLSTHSESQPLRWLTASQGETLKMIAVEDVRYFQADAKYTKVVTNTQEAWLRISLKELAQKLDPQHFWQVHRSVIVAVTCIDSVAKNELGQWHLQLRGSSEYLPVSQEFQRRLRAL